LPFLEQGIAPFETVTCYLRNHLVPEFGHHPGRAAEMDTHPKRLAAGPVIQQPAIIPPSLHARQFTSLLDSAFNTLKLKELQRLGDITRFKDLVWLECDCACLT
jgi:hypothetical protein